MSVFIGSIRVVRNNPNRPSGLGKNFIKVEDGHWVYVSTIKSKPLVNNVEIFVNPKEKIYRRAMIVVQTKDKQYTAFAKTPKSFQFAARKAANGDIEGFLNAIKRIDQ